jgi:membrane-bound metal-dependent hydrolase YbcI (DUF457 family)
MERTKDENGNSTPEGLGSRVTVSILTFFGSLIGIVLWLFFYADKFTVYQNIAVVAVILIGFVATMGATWAAWGIKQAERQGKKGSAKSC